MNQNFHLLPVLPNLLAKGFEETSPQSDAYNCIAWAAEDVEKWWWPDEESYWPDGIPREQSLDSFIAVFASLGYSVCDNGDLETGYDKIAIYTTNDGPQHAARQYIDGKWSSKLGRFEDISHNDVRGVECKIYGNATLYMKRPKKDN